MQIDRNTLAMGMGIAVAVGAGLTLVFESPLGAVAGIFLGLAVIIGRHQSRKKEKGDE